MPDNPIQSVETMLAIPKVAYVSARIY